MSTNVLPQSDRPQLEGNNLSLGSMRKAVRYDLADSTLEKSDGWVSLCTGPQKASGEVLRQQLGRPGLWKTRTDASRLKHHRIFEVPTALLEQATNLRSIGEEDEALQEFLQWGLATADAERASAWSPPALEEVESWFAKEQLTFQSGPILRQGSLIHSADRLALSFPIVSGWPADLPEQRASWLREQLIDANNRIRMLRIGIAEDGAVLTEFDLTGAPESLLESLLRVGLDALRWCVQWLVGSVEFLVDNGIPSRALELFSPRV